MKKKTDKKSRKQSKNGIKEKNIVIIIRVSDKREESEKIHRT